MLAKQLILVAVAYNLLWLSLVGICLILNDMFKHSWYFMMCSNIVIFIFIPNDLVDSS